MDHPKAGICVLWLMGVATAQTVQQGLTKPTPAVMVTPTNSRAQLEPVILTRASLDEKVITLRLAPRVDENAVLRQRGRELVRVLPRSRSVSSGKRWRPIQFVWCSPGLGR